MIMSDPGIPVLEPMGATGRCLGEVVIRSAGAPVSPGTPDDVAASELIRDLEEVVR